MYSAIQSPQVIPDPLKKHRWLLSAATSGNLLVNLTIARRELIAFNRILLQETREVRKARARVGCKPFLAGRDLPRFTMLLARCSIKVFDIPADVLTIVGTLGPG